MFILLLFLLMLLFLALNQEWEQQAREAEDKLVEVTAIRDTLAAAEEARRDRIRTLTRQRDEAAQRAADARRLLDRSANELLQEAQAAREKARAAGEEARVAQEEAQEARREAVAQVAAANERAEQARNLLAKGENPPCWYRRVSDGRDGEREKPYYSFEVGVFDDHLIVRWLPPPPGGAEDDNQGSFADEAQRLGFDALPYGQRLSDSEFVRHFSPAWRAGKNKRVRSYSCIFWVRVWDQTAPGAKTRWKRAHDRILEGLFGAYQVRDEPW